MTFKLVGYKTLRVGFKGHLTEDGIQVASVQRNASSIRDYKVKWFTERAYYRFQDFCNCESVDETLEAIEPSC